MKQKKIRRYKGNLFARTRRRWPLVLLTLVLFLLLAAALAWAVVTMLRTGRADGPSSSAPTAPTQTQPTTAPTSAPTTAPTSAPTTAPTTAPTSSPTTGISGEAIAALARTLVDKEYVSMGNGPDVFDNYGLVYYCLKTCGVEQASRRITRLLRDGAEVAAGAWQPGDVVFFSNNMDGNADYMGIYVGDGLFIASNRPGVPSCSYKMSNPYFAQRYVAARRFA